MAKDIRVEYVYAFSTLLTKLPLADSYIVTVESETDYRAYFTFPRTSAKTDFVYEVLTGGQWGSWLTKLSLQLGESVAAYVMPDTAVRSGGLKWMPLQAEAVKRIPFITATYEVVEQQSRGRLIKALAKAS